jgi:hypothetical protein
MKIIFGFFIAIISFAVMASQTGTVSGFVNLPNDLSHKITPAGVLYVFAKKNQANGQPPVAVIKIMNPKFPQKFSISAQNIMIGGSKFEGPLFISARYSPSGNPMSSSDSLESTTADLQAVKIGATNIQLNLAMKNRSTEIKIPMH